MTSLKHLSIVATLVSTSALAQFAPTGPVRINSAFPTGSGPDVVSRLVADQLQARWGQPVMVLARPGGAGTVAINGMKAAAPTGHDLAVVDVGTLSINPLIFKRLSYDPTTDLVPVALLYKTAFFVAVASDSPYKSFKDLQAAAADKNAPLRYGSNAVGGPIHLGSARLESAMGAEMLHVPYKETSLLYSAVTTGELHWAYGSIATAGGLVRGSKLRFLAVADRERSPAMPDVPTLEEAGGPKGLDALTWVAVMAPRGTPANVVAAINSAVNDALSHKDVKEKMLNFGFVVSAGPAQQVTELMQGDRARYAEVLKRVKVSVD